MSNSAVRGALVTDLLASMEKHLLLCVSLLAERGSMMEDMTVRRCCVYLHIVYTDMHVLCVQSLEGRGTLQSNESAG